MKILARTFRTLLLLALLAVMAGLGSKSFASLQEPAPRSESGEFFSGNIADLSAERVTVSRTILGKPAEQRAFLIKPETKVEGTMKAGARVTVRYATGDQGDVALSILVRADKPDKK